VLSENLLCVFHAGHDDAADFNINLQGCFFTVFTDM